MSALALRSEHDPAKSGVTGRADLTVGAEDGVTRIKHLYHSEPLRLLFPHVGRGECFSAVLTNTGGGLVGGDTLNVSVVAEPEATLQVMAQAAEKVYRSARPDVTMGAALKAEAGAWLEWLPQEAIIFDNARLRRCTALDVADGGSALAGEMLVFGREAHGEAVRAGLIRDAWEVRRNGRLVWADALHLDSDIQGTLHATPSFDGARGYASLVFVGDGAQDMLDSVREAARHDGVRTGATFVNGVLVVRWLSEDGQALRRSYAAVWGLIRQARKHLPAAMPRLWNI